MRMMVLLLVVCCVAMAAPAWSQAPRPATGVVDAPSGDPFWLPTDKQLQQWASDGIDVARANGSIVDAPGVEPWVWWHDKEGVPCGEGYSLVAVAVLAPRPALTAAGYWSAWDGSTWDRIQLNQNNVAIDVSQTVRYSLFGTQVEFALALVGGEEDEGNQTAAVWYNGEWRHLGTLDGGSAADRIEGPDFGERGWRWIGGYLLAKAIQARGHFELDKVWIVYGSMPLHQRMIPDEAFTQAVPAPGEGILRVAIGTPEEYAYADF